MKDLSDEMLPGKPVSRKMRALLDKERKAGRQRIIERGIVHFRADKEFMEALLDAADRLKIAPGTLCRRLVWQHLQAMSSSQQGEPSDLIAIARELQSGQEEIRSELQMVLERLSEPESIRKS